MAFLGDVSYCYALGSLWCENCNIGVRTTDACLIILGMLGSGGSTTPVQGNVFTYEQRGDNVIDMFRADRFDSLIHVTLFYEPNKTPTIPFWLQYDPAAGKGSIRAGATWMPWCFREIYRDDYGGNFANFTPPTPEAQGHIFFAEDTNSTNPAKRLYISLDGSTWSYVDLT